MNLPGLLIAPLLAFLVLVAFLSFWVAVVICLATASSPGQSPIALFDNTAAQKQPLPANAVFVANNSSLNDGRSKYKYILLYNILLGSLLNFL